MEKEQLQRVGDRWTGLEAQQRNRVRAYWEDTWGTKPPEKAASGSGKGRGTSAGASPSPPPAPQGQPAAAQGSPGMNGTSGARFGAQTAPSRSPSIRQLAHTERAISTHGKGGTLPTRRTTPAVIPAGSARPRGQSQLQRWCRGRPTRDGNASEQDEGEPPSRTTDLTPGKAALDRGRGRCRGCGTPWWGWLLGP